MTTLREPSRNGKRLPHDPERCGKRDEATVCDNCWQLLFSPPRAPRKYANINGDDTQRRQRTQSTQRTEKTQTPRSQSAPSAHSGVSGASVCQRSSTDAGISESHRRAIFRLARRLKTDDPEKPPGDAMLREAWLSDGFLKRIPWDDFRLLVMEGWDSVKYLLGQGPLAGCLAKADAQPLPEFAERYDQLQLKRLVKLCAVLQELKGQEPFALAANALVDELAISLATAARWLRLLVRDGVLQLGKAGRPGRASEYWYVAM